MLIGYTDVSLRDDLLSIGYHFVRPCEKRGETEVVEMGHRLLNTNRLAHFEASRSESRQFWRFADEAPHDYCSTRAEYRGLISAVRRALDYDDTYLMLYSDSEAVVEKIKEGEQLDQSGYFHHAFHSFAERFASWHVSWVPRERNEIAHEQARTGLKLVQEYDITV